MGTRVALTGWDGDALLCESPRPYFRSLARQGRLGRLLAGGLRYAWSERRLLPARTGRAVRSRTLPAWIQPDFARSQGLAERLAERSARRAEHPVRPHAFPALPDPQPFEGAKDVQIRHLQAAVTFSASRQFQ